MGEVERFLEQAARYRRMMASVDDKRAHAVLQALALEHEDKASKLQPKTEISGLDATPKSASEIPDA